MNFFILPKNRISKIPERTGVYKFLDRKGEILYIGKAINLKKRVQNHFIQPVFKDNILAKQTKKVGYLTTNSEIEALILESQLIKKYQPKYNTTWKDDKNYFYVGITKEELPKVFISHQIKTNSIEQIANGKRAIRPMPLVVYIGPFVDGGALKQALRYLRKVIPYYTAGNHPKTPCPWCHLNLCPGPEPDKKNYQKNIKYLSDILRGKIRSVLKNLRKEMKLLAKEEKFEAAASFREKIVALESIMEHGRIFSAQRKLTSGNWPRTQAMIKKILRFKKMNPPRRKRRGIPRRPGYRAGSFGGFRPRPKGQGILAAKIISRIEAYDISNIQGKEATGSMIVFLNGLPQKKFYRKFKIKMQSKPNDTAMLKEVLSRRLSHNEWRFPELILIDGGKAQLSAAASEIADRGLPIPVIALAKKHNELFLENKKEPLLLRNISGEISNLILQLRDEAHRFALTYHRLLREKKLLKPEIPASRRLLKK